MTVFESQKDETEIDIFVGDCGIVKLERYESSSGVDKKGNYTGISIGNFLYTSTDYDSYYSGYFALGLVLEDVTPDVIYIHYLDYKMKENCKIEYDLNSESTTGGLFA